MEYGETTTKLKGKLLLNLGEKTNFELSSNLRGKLLSTHEIQKYKSYIDSLKPICIENNCGYAQLLSGETKLSYKNRYSLRLPRTIQEGLVKTTVDLKFGLGKYLDTGVNYNKLLQTNAKGRYKIYTSLLLDSEDKKMQATNFFMEIFDFCYSNKLSIGYKVSDHNYDSFLLYTRDIDKIEQKIQELYQKYKIYGIFNSVPHFLQKPINGIDENHIGIVNEPILGYLDESHSGRMRVLGKLIDEGKDYISACKIVGILPDKPYNIDRNNEEVIKNYKY